MSIGFDFTAKRTKARIRRFNGRWIVICGPRLDENIAAYEWCARNNP